MSRQVSPQSAQTQWSLIHTLRTPLGISFKTQALYVAVFVTRYLDLFAGEWVSLYNTVMKLFFIGSSVYILYLMKFRFKSVPHIDVSIHLHVNGTSDLSPQLSHLVKHQNYV